MNASIEAAGFGITGNIGGLFKQTYYTPDGRVLKAVPMIRNWVRTDKDGKAVESGLRDAHLDKGWLLQKPTTLKLFCPTCDRWHDTSSEIKACKLRNDRMIARQNRIVATQRKDAEKANKEAANKYNQTKELKKKVAALESLVEKLLRSTEEIHGGILQQDYNEPAGAVPGRNGKSKEGVQ